MPEFLSSSEASKRKRDTDNDHRGIPTPTKKDKKRDSLSATAPATNDNTAQKRNKLKDALQGGDQAKPTWKEGVVSTKRNNADAPKSHDRDATSARKSKDGKRRSFAAHDEVADVSEALSRGHFEDEEKADEDQRKAPKNKHAGILSKFERTKTAASAKPKETKVAVDQKSQTVEPVIAKGLEPLPQPEQPAEEEALPSYSSLPEWLANPLRTSAAERTKFSKMGIKSGILRSLDQNNYKEAFAVQATVIPLLLEGNNKHHQGDLCVSAATGSGKTLSYVLPMVNSLKARPASRLRGLIVVPTRELVKQARETCELLASGSGLRIASAVGNVAIKDEQKILMRMDQVYSPETVAKRERSSLRTNQDWMNFSLEDCVAEALESADCLPGHILQPETNVDILVCTPGRLVDHIRYTKGFSLKHIEWFVIDEADRLLNESFQEWVDVVMGSINARESPSALGFAGEFFSRMGLPFETKPPKKVILSATMTRDITKLNSLRLSNPKMVVIGAEIGGDANDQPAPTDDAHYDLPPSLHEYFVPVGDGSQKPLYLLRLLTTRINVGVDSDKDLLSALSDSESSSSAESDDDDTSSDESSSDVSSDSDSASSKSRSEKSNTENGDSSSELVAARGSRPTTVLIFTKSSESASRLSRLVVLLYPSLASRVGLIVKSNNSSASRKTLAAYRQGRISIIVATDRASRGLDLQSLDHVVNYDMPASITTYVHRVGRTARAGREGSAWTLVAYREGRWFSSEISASENGRITRSTAIERINVKLDANDDQKDYGTALEALEKEVKGTHFK